MSEKLPVDYRDYGKMYTGKPQRHPAEQYGDAADLSKPDGTAMSPDGKGGPQDPEDKIHPERPQGASTTPVSDKKKRTVVWRAKGRK